MEQYSNSYELGCLSNFIDIMGMYSKECVAACYSKQMERLLQRGRLCKIFEKNLTYIRMQHYKNENSNW